ncbi:MAG: SGNH/GDSL hydrolase family protein [Armatimonadetes bacterium]|nr:SGNH/GDSL hydrolase family protein [Armatimonadota bacterium]
MRASRPLVLTVVGLIATLCCQCAAGAQWGYRQVSSTDPALPHVLLVGDSIVGGYNAQVAVLLQGKANVDYWMTGGHLGAPGFNDQLEKVLTEHHYDVIHFNESGLHAWPAGRIPEGQYGPLMRGYLAMIRRAAPQARLIWASNTPVTVEGHPEALNPEINPIIVSLNQAVRPIMVEHNVPVDDLHTLMLDRLNLAAGDRFHWTKPGRDLQAEAVSNAILQALAPPDTPAKPQD